MRALIRQRLAETQPQHPEIARLPGWGDIPRALQALRPKRLMPAAVLVALVDRGDGLQLLLTQRAEHLKHHAGQISFPGGRVEAGDAGPMAAALRETEEEVGLAANRIEVVGYLENYLTITGYSVTPVVGFFDSDMVMNLDRSEVDDAFEVPLSHLFDPANHHQRSKEMFGHVVPYYEIAWQDRLIWGATAAMIICFYQTVLGVDQQ